MKGGLTQREEMGLEMFRSGNVRQWIGDRWVVCGCWVNLYDHTCDCEDFRSHKHLQSVGFSCKHLFGALFAQGALDEETEARLAKIRTVKEGNGSR